MRREMKQSVRTSGWVSMVAVCFGSACADSVDEHVGRAQLALQAPDCSAFGATLVEHSCMHAQAGPFMMVMASASDAAAQAPSINNVHTHYTVKLPLGAAGTVRYRPQRSGEWVFLFDRDVSLQVQDEAGKALVQLHASMPTACAGLKSARSFELAAGASYQLELGPLAGDEVSIVIEKLDDFVQTYYADQDADGHGDPKRPEATACMPGAGLVQDDTDCDDTREEVHPDTAELCNDRDDDCDGRIDEQVRCDDRAELDAGVSSSGARGAQRVASAGAGGAAARVSAEAGRGGHDDVAGRSAFDEPASSALDAGTSSPRGERAGQAGRAAEPADAPASEAQTTVSADDRSGGCQCVVSRSTRPSVAAGVWCLLALMLARRLGASRRRRTQRAVGSRALALSRRCAHSK